MHLRRTIFGVLSAMSVCCTSGAITAQTVLLKEQQLLVESQPLAYVETTRDGIAILPMSSVLGVVPELRSRHSDGLHLVRHGRLVPLALIDDDGKISDNDTILFVGIHSNGDTTYFHAYSSVATFRLVYDTAIPPRRIVRDTATTIGQIRQHLWMERHWEEEHEYVQGWLDNDRYRQNMSTFVTETVPGEGWVWAITYPLRPFVTVLPIVPDPTRDDSVEITVVYSAISDDIYTAPDHRMQLLVGGLVRDSNTYDGPRYDTLRTIVRPRRDGYLGDSLMLRNTATTIAAEALDYIVSRGTECAAAWRDGISGSCVSARNERLEVVNFRSGRVYVIDTAAARWHVRTGNSGVFVRVSARTSPQRITVAFGDTFAFTVRHPIVVAWLDQNRVLQQFSDNSSAVAGLIGALPVGTPYAIAIANGNRIEQSLRDRLAAEGSTVSAALASGQCYVACGIRGQPERLREVRADSVAAVVAWLLSERGNGYSITVPLGEGPHAIVATGSEKIETAHVRPCRGAHLLDDTNAADYLIITHERFRPAAERLAQYRSRRNGVVARIVDVGEIFDTFGHGEKSPHAIKEFLRFAYQQWRRFPRYVLLVGDASWDPRKVSSDALNDDFIPSYGKPVSDYWYTLLDGDDLIAETSIGRLPVQTLAQADAIVSKIIEHDTMSVAQWHKQFLFITGGADPAEQLDFYESVIYSLVPLLVDPFQRALCADTVVASLYAGTRTGVPLPMGIVQAINNGTGWINYIGHGAPRSLEVAGWEPERLHNVGRYPILASFSCQIGAFAEPNIGALGEDFLSAPRAGMVAVIATTGFGIRSYDDVVNTGIFATLAREHMRAIGPILNRAKLYLFDGSQSAINTIMQTSLLGDPLTRIPIDSLPYPVLEPQSLRIESNPPAPIVSTDAESVLVTATVFNAGPYADSTVEVRLIRRYQHYSDTTTVQFDGLCHPQQVRFTIPIKDMGGEHQLRFECDPEQRLGRTFPAIETTLYVYAERLYAVEPQPGWNLSPSDTIFRFLSPLAATGAYEYDVVLLSDAGDTIADSRSSPIVTTSTHCQWAIPSVLQVGKQYRLYIRAYNQSRQQWTAPLDIPFIVTDQAALDTIEDRHGGSFGWRRTTNVGFDTTERKQLSLSKRQRVELLSAGGYRTLRSDTMLIVQPAYRLRIGGTNVASERSDETGVHLAVVSSSDGEVKAVRWYTTWTTSRIARSDGGNTELVDFLRDSVADDDYVVLVSCGEAWGVQFPQFAESVRRTLELYGAQLSDSLQRTRSYIFVGMRSPLRPFVFEKIGNDVATGGSDTIAMNIELVLFPRQGRIEFPVAGPARTWDSIALEIACPTVAIELQVYGGNDPSTTTTLVYQTNNPQGELGQIDASSYPFLRVVCIYRRDSSDFAECRVMQAMIRYQPLPEIATVLAANDRTPLRGDTVQCIARTVNLVSRSSPQSLFGAWQVTDHAGVPIALSTLPSSVSIRAGDTSTMAVIPTVTLPESTTVEYAIGGIRDLYRFNNSAVATIAVRPDLTAPIVRAYAGDQLMGDTAIVPPRLRLDCALLDSARIAITDSTALVLRLNGIRLPLGSLRYVFYPTSQTVALERWRNDPLVRAAVETDVELERGTNVLIVTARDAAGNATTAQYVLIVPQELALDSTAVVPNPVSSGDVRFRVVYRGFEQNVPATLELYDALGRRVRSRSLQLYFGTNDVTIPLSDESSGGLLQSGAYYWRVWLDPLGADNAVGGMLLIVR
ncbi:MAG: C25 family cysteine peptidase [Chlorobi bacterium]|nr:C25 family cysteine peptidase [Chlorobiota bacterium]